MCKENVLNEFLFNGSYLFHRLIFICAKKQSELHGPNFTHILRRTKYFRKTRYHPANRLVCLPKAKQAYGRKNRWPEPEFGPAVWLEAIRAGAFELGPSAGLNICLAKSTTRQRAPDHHSGGDYFGPINQPILSCFGRCLTKERKYQTSDGAYVTLQ